MSSLAFKAVHALIQLGKLEPYAASPAAKSVVMQGRVALFASARDAAPEADEDGLALHTRLAAFVEDPLGTRKWPSAPGTLYPPNIRGSGLAWSHLWREARAAAVYGMPDAAMMLLDSQIEWSTIGGETARDYAKEKIFTLASRRHLRSKLVRAAEASAPSAHVIDLPSKGESPAEGVVRPFLAIVEPEPEPAAPKKKARKPRKKKDAAPAASAAPANDSKSEDVPEVKH